MKAVTGTILGLLSLNNYTMSQNEKSHYGMKRRLKYFNLKKKSVLILLPINFEKLSDQDFPNIINGQRL
jgi:hypothetical protein